MTIPNVGHAEARTSAASTLKLQRDKTASSKERADLFSTQFEGFTVCESVPVQTIQHCFQRATLQEKTLKELKEVLGEVTIEKELGSGGCSTVFAVRIDKTEDPTTSKKFALKLLKVRDLSETTKQRSLRITPERKGGEALALGLAHKNLIHTEALISVSPEGAIKVTTEKDAVNSSELNGHTIIGILSELFEGKELFELLNEAARNDEELAPNTIRRIGKQIGKGLAYMHLMNLAHRDIKTENILVDNSLKAKLIDFGFCRDLSGHRRANSLIGTIDYLAPEMHFMRISEGLSYDQKIDSYAFGILLFYMRYDELPWELGHLEEYDNSSRAHCMTLADYYTSGQNLHEFFLGISSVYNPNVDIEDDQLMDLIIKLTHSNPEKRLSIAEALSHPFFIKK